jgi:quercetin dioxygenase-like cupin family protein
MVLRATAGAICGVVVTLGMVRAQSGTPIPVDQEPRHRIVFADDRLRVLEVRIPARDTSLDHRHDFDLATVNIENGPTRTWSSASGWSAVRPREVGGVNVAEYTGKASAHIVQNVGEVAYRLTGVENLRTRDWTVHPPIDDPAATVISESRGFRAYQIDLTRAYRATHTHPVPVVITLIRGEAAAPQPPQTAVLTRPGEWRLVPAGVAHALTTDAGARVIEMEIR